MLPKIILHLHALTAAGTIFLLVFRFIAIQMNAKFMRLKIAKILPIINDTFLLIFGITLIIIKSRYPNFSHNLWLLEKLAFLVAYIFFGYFALKSTTSFRYISLILALICFSAIVFLVKTKTAF